VRSPLTVDALDNGRVYYARLEAITPQGRALSNEAAARPTTLEFDRSVFALAHAPDGGLYLGGDFTRIGLTSGHGVALDATTGRPSIANYPVVSGGGVSAAAPDGAGGWFIGGDFLRVGNVDRKYLAHVKADGSLDTTFAPQPDGPVKAMAVMSGTLYLGGTFSRINGQRRVGLGAVEAIGTGRLTAWNPGPDLGVFAIAAANGTIYVGGTFTDVGGFRRNRLAAIDTWANVLPWDRDANGTVMSLAVANGTVYAGGFFQAVSGKQRAMVAAIDAASGNVRDWNPSSQACVGCQVLTLALNGNTLYVGGRFQQIGAALRKSLAAVDATSGAVLPLNPAFGGFQVRALAASASTLYVGGDYEGIGGQPRAYLAALDGSGAVVAGWQPAPNGVVDTLVASGNAVYAGGRFTGLNAVVRNRLAAIDASGALKAWHPNLNAAVFALTMQGNQLVAGGQFTAVGTQPRARLAKFDESGALNAWNPGADQPVRALAASPYRLYVGGEFNGVAGQPRGRLAAFDASGALTPWHPAADGAVLALAIGPTLFGETVYVGGRFGYVGYASRRRIAQIDGYGLSTPWNPWGYTNVSPTEEVRALRYADGEVHAGGAFVGIGPNLSTIDAASGALRVFAGTTYPVSTLAVVGRTLHVGGAFVHAFDAAGHNGPRTGLAAFDLDTRTLTAYAPQLIGGEVYALAPAVDGGLHVRGSFTQVNGQVRSGFATLVP
jgi:hypothetical protein